MDVLMKKRMNVSVLNANVGLSVLLVLMSCRAQAGLGKRAGSGTFTQVRVRRSLPPGNKRHCGSRY